MKRIAPIVLVAVAALALAAPTYTVCEAHLDSIAGIITRETGDYARASSEPGKTFNTLDGLPGNYADTIAEINAQATANPDDAAWQMAKSRLAKFTTDFQALKAKAEAAKLAFTLIDSKGAVAVKTKLEELQP